ncbi:acetyltransferase [Marinomonas sp. MED121]|uniref:GNAT family N-acetyltransferase n=1 Tax=Marinomonas sp. MED121 TaxID=314277 RepID=UPI0000690B3B|nr:GNAT family N-acetyltransferase [Marinomonas sp. MED121]EAQ65921.1 acetyltransferase [Marinomonas sp. MED121]
MKSLFYTRVAIPSDVENILTFEQENKEWFLNYLPQSYLDKMSLEFIRNQISHQKQKKHYLIYTHSGLLIGRFNLYFLDDERKHVEVMYRIDRKWVGKGIASYILKRLVAYWASSGVEQVFATTLKSNLASNRLLISAGFHLSKEISQPILIRGVSKEAIEYVWSIDS